MHCISSSLIRTLIHVLLICLIAVVFSCSNENIEKLKESVLIVSSQTESIQDGCYHDIFITNDSLLVLISNCDSSFFSIYNKHSLKYIASFGKKGKGPFDFNFPFPFKTSSIQQSDNLGINIYDLNKPDITTINFSSLINSENPKDAIKAVTIDKEIFSMNDLCQLSNHKIAGTNNDNPSGLIFIFDQLNKTMQYLPYYPVYKDVEDRFKNDLYLGTLCSNGRKIAFAYYYFDLISFYNSDGTLMIQHAYSNLVKPRLSKTFTGVEYDNRMYFTQSFATREFLFVLRVTQTWYDLRDSNSYPSDILQFDWDGNLIDKYSLKYTPNCICFDEKENTLFCIETKYPIDGNVNIKKYKL